VADDLVALGSAGLATALLVAAAVVVTVAVLLCRTAIAGGMAHCRVARRRLPRGGAAGGKSRLGVGLVVGRGQRSADRRPAGARRRGRGLVAARLWAPLAGLAARLIPRRSVAGRIGLLGAIRRPLRPVATTAFLTAAVASVVFAGRTARPCSTARSTRRPTRCRWTPR